MALTIADLRKYEKSPLTKGVMDIFLMEHELSQFVPTTKINTMKARVVRQVSLPTPGWRSLGTPFTESKGSVDWAEETVYSVGGYVTSDKLLEEDANVIRSPLQDNVKMFAKALAYEFNDRVVNGDNASNPDAPDGIIVRVANLASAQTIDGTGIDISASGYTDADGDLYLDALDQLIYALDGHKGDGVYLLMNDKMLLRTWSVLRRLKVLDTTKDQFGREISTYKGAKLIDVGVKADQSTRILSADLDGSNLSSILAVKMGEDYFHMLNYQPLKVTDQGLLEDGITLRVQTEWTFGFMQAHPRGLARLKKIQHSA